MATDEKTVLKFLSYFLPLTYIPVGLPLVLKLIAPNGIYGFRIAGALENLDAWYFVNFVGGISLIIAGLLSLVFVFLLHENSKLGSLNKLIVSYVISIVTLMIAIFSTVWLG